MTTEQLDRPASVAAGPITADEILAIATRCVDRFAKRSSDRDDLLSEAAYAGLWAAREIEAKPKLAASILSPRAYVAKSVKHAVRKAILKGCERRRTERATDFTAAGSPDRIERRTPVDAIAEAQAGRFFETFGAALLIASFGLTPPQWEALHLIYGEGVSLRNAASRLGISVGSLQKRADAAKEKILPLLRELFSESPLPLTDEE